MAGHRPPGRRSDRRTRRRRPGRRQCGGDGDGAAHLDARRRRRGSGRRRWPRRRATRGPGRLDADPSTRYGDLLPPGLGLLGLAERTGVIDHARRAVAGGRRGRGPTGSRRGAPEPIVARPGDRIDGPRLARDLSPGHRVRASADPTDARRILEPMRTDLGWRLDPAVTFLNHGIVRRVPDATSSRSQRALREELESEPVRFLTRRPPGAARWRARESVAAFLGADPDGLAFVPERDDRRSTRSSPASGSSRATSCSPTTTSTTRRSTRCAPSPSATGRGSWWRRSPSRSPAPTWSSMALLAAVTPRTRLLVVSHVTSPTALVFPIERLVREFDGRGIDTLVDGAHAPGMVPVDVDALGAAYWTGNGHKWLCGPKGTGVLWVRDDRRDADPSARRLARRERAAGRPDALSAGSSTGSGRADPTGYLTLPSRSTGWPIALPGGWPGVMAAEPCAGARRPRRIRASARDRGGPAPDAMLGSMAAIPLPGDRGPRLPRSSSIAASVGRAASRSRCRRGRSGPPAHDADDAAAGRHRPDLGRSATTSPPTTTRSARLSRGCSIDRARADEPDGPPKRAVRCARLGRRRRRRARRGVRRRVGRRRTVPASRPSRRSRRRRSGSRRRHPCGCAASRNAVDGVVSRRRRARGRRRIRAGGRHGGDTAADEQQPGDGSGEDRATDATGRWSPAREPARETGSPASPARVAGWTGPCDLLGVRVGRGQADRCIRASGGSPSNEPGRIVAGAHERVVRTTESRAAGPTARLGRAPRPRPGAGSPPSRSRRGTGSARARSGACRPARPPPPAAPTTPR